MDMADAHAGIDRRETGGSVSGMAAAICMARSYVVARMGFGRERPDPRCKTPPPVDKVPG